ncbi:hypothetical protein VTL71DRAFT_1466 [Oculimacula yallundae]|uniref:Uncharacterized protein n=1 Tax=Oculimacula yallundae TaxID=86028 RepID=A0ABR4CAS2_9HELO
MTLFYYFPDRQLHQQLLSSPALMRIWRSPRHHLPSFTWVFLQLFRFSENKIIWGVNWALHAHGLLSSPCHSCLLVCSYFCIATSHAGFPSSSSFLSTPSASRQIPEKRKSRHSTTSLSGQTKIHGVGSFVSYPAYNLCFFRTGSGIWIWV